MSTPIQSPSSHSSASSAPSAVSLLLDATGLADAKADSQQSGSTKAFINLVETSEIKAGDLEAAEAKPLPLSLSDKAIKEGANEIDDVLLQTLNALPVEAHDDASLNLSPLVIASPHANTASLGNSALGFANIRASHGGEGEQLKTSALPSKGLIPQASHLDSALTPDGALSSNQELPKIARGDLRIGLEALAQSGGTGVPGSKPVNTALAVNAITVDTEVVGKDQSAALTETQLKQQALASNSTQSVQQAQAIIAANKAGEKTLSESLSASGSKARSVVNSTASLESADNVSQARPLEQSSDRATNDYKHSHLLDIKPNDQMNRVFDNDINRLPSIQSNLVQASQITLDNSGLTSTSGVTSLNGLPVSSSAAMASTQAGTAPSQIAYAQVMSTENGYVINNNELALTITQIRNNGNNSLRIKLDPQELGRIDVRLDMANDGLSKIVLNVDRPETFDLLNREGRELQRTLEQMGVKFGEHGVKITLGDSNQGHSDQSGEGDARGDEDFVSADDDEQQKNDHQSAKRDEQDIERLYATLRPNGLDIRL